MVKTTLWSRAKGLCLLAALTLAAATANAKVLLNENFEYSTSELIGDGISNGTWIQYGANPEDAIRLTEPGLSKSGYQDEAKGKRVELGNVKLAKDAQAVFEGESIKEGSIYYAALINLTEAPTDKANHFMALIQPPYSGILEAGKAGTEFAMLSALQTETGKYKLQVSRSNTTIAATEKTYTYGTTYLVVVKFTVVEGTSNDEVRLYVDPTSEAEPATADALYNSSSGSDLSRGILGLELCQTQTATRNAATVSIDAVRVATTWAELFNPTSTGGDPDPATPTIIAPTGITFNEVFSNEQYEQKITVKGTDLEGDVTFAVDCDQVTLSATSADKDQVMSDEGFELTLKLLATDATCTAPKLTITSHNATTIEVPLSWTLITTIDVPDLASLRTKVATVNLDEFPLFRVLGPTAVSYQDGDQTIYLQDDKGGFRLQDDYSVWTGKNFAIGTKVAAGLIGYVTQEFGYYFSPIRITTDGETDVKAVTATLAEIDADKAAYADRLVRIEHVKFANSGQKFGTSQETFSQNGIEAKLRQLASVTDIAGQDIPARATVVGISTSASAVIIAPRGWSDITPESTTGNTAAANDAAICYANDGTLYIEHAAADITIYNLTGICVAKAIAAERIAIGLPQGVYAVKIGDKTQKVVVR